MTDQMARDFAKECGSGRGDPDSDSHQSEGHRTILRSRHRFQKSTRVKGLLFTFLLTYGGGLVSLFNPFVGLLIYICFAIIKPESLWYWSVPAGNYSRIVFGALFVGWAMAGFGSWRLGRARAGRVGLAGTCLVRGQRDASADQAPCLAQRRI